MTLDLLLLFAIPALLVTAIVVLFRDTARAFRLFGYLLVADLVLAAGGILRVVNRVYDFASMSTPERLAVLMLGIVAISCLGYGVFGIRQGKRANEGEP